MTLHIRRPRLSPVQGLPSIIAAANHDVALVAAATGEGHFPRVLCGIAPTDTPVILVCGTGAAHIIPNLDYTPFIAGLAAYFKCVRAGEIAITPATDTPSGIFMTLAGSLRPNVP